MYAGVSASFGREGFGQLAGGVHLPKKHVGDRPAAGLAHHPRFEHRRRAVDPFAHRHRRAVVEDDHTVLGWTSPTALINATCCGRQVQVGAVVAFGFFVRGQGDVEQRHVGGSCLRHGFVDQGLAAGWYLRG